ncbi:hypothetical protein BJV78DRAFT_1210631 [Lactifluus subvellereus]|nr:hypothetical protein BJV78DRAFT_1210631 [Lactifluus subvellereus]
MAHSVERTDSPWRSSRHGAPPLGVVYRCPTEVLPGRERKFRSLVGKVSFGLHEAPLRASRVSLLCVQLEALQIGEDQGGDVSAGIDLSSQLEAAAYGRRLTDVDPHQHPPCNVDRGRARSVHRNTKPIGTDDTRK